MDLRFLWPILLISTLLGARIWELRRRFEAEPGNVVGSPSFKRLVAVGTASVLLCLGAYWYRGTPPASPGASLAGVALGASTFILRAKSRRALGRMWSVHVEIRDRHILVSEGPYARVRHPIYLAALMEVVATALVLNTWICGGLALLATALVVAGRIRIEERAMEEKFGDAWRQYRLRTNSLWPRP